MHEGEVYAGGLDLEFYDSPLLENEDPLLSNEHGLVTRNVLRVLMMGWYKNWKDLVSWRVFSAVFIERNHQLTKGMRAAFQQGFEHIYSQLEEARLSPLQHNQAELYLSNCLTLLPFSDITPYESFAIPQWVNGRWQLIDYKVVPIELTPTSGFKKLFLNDKDRVFAYGLEPIAEKAAQSHLIFMGTTYPAGQGFITQINTDSEGFATVGNKLYKSGRANITKWLDKQNKPVHVCGTSLGGSLSLLCAIDQGEKISRVDALNPAGLYKSWRKCPYDHWDEIDNKPLVYIQKQGDDPVSRFGVWKKEWHVLKVTPPIDKKGPNLFIDHALNYAGFSGTEFTGVDTQVDNEERKHRDFFIYTIFRSIFYYSSLIPYRYVILPLWRYCFNHKLQILLTIPFILVAGTEALIVGWTSAFLLSNLILFTKDQFSHKKESDISKFYQWWAGNSVLVKASIVGGLIIYITSMVAIPFFFPLMASPLLLGMLSLPWLMKEMDNAYTLVKAFLGWTPVETLECHHPDLPRNEDLDIYSNYTQAMFTLKELSDYHASVGEAYGDLIAGPDDAGESSVTVHETRAKIYTMKQTIELVNRFGIHQCKKEVEELHREYENGRVNPNSCT